MEENNLNIAPLLGKVTFENPEWCFQFDNEEPHIIYLNSSETDPINKKLVIEIKGDSTSNIVFQKDGKQFKIFAREKKI